MSPRFVPSAGAVVVLVVLCLVPTAVGVATVSRGVGAQSSPAVTVSNVTHTPTTPAAGQTFEVSVRIENHESATGSVQLTEVYVRGLDSSYVADDLGTLSPGSSTVVTLPVTVESPGWTTFSVHVNGRGGSSGSVNVRHPVTVHVVAPQRPQLELSVQDAIPGATRSVNVTVANGATTDVRQVAVDVSSPTVQFDLARRVQARLSAGNTTTFHFPASVAESGSHPVNVTLHYTENGDRHRLSRTFRTAFDGPANPGKIRLTGTDAVAHGGSLELSATASNVGSTPVDGVVVSIDGGPRVSSADYFVGSVDGSDFSSFTLTTSRSGNVSSVPVTVRYVVDGVEKSSTTDVPVDRASGGSPDRSGARGGPPVVPIAGIVVVLVVLALGYRWRRR